MQNSDTISLWDGTSGESEPPSDTLSGSTVDVAIVGGGFTGLSTALHCAEAGMSVQLIEAERLGHGGSGRNVGLVNAAAWLPPGKVMKLLGPRYGPVFLNRFSAAPRTVFDLIEKHQIVCEVTRSGTIHAAHSARGMADLRGRFAEWRKLDAPVELLGPDEVRKLTGAAGFHGGLLDRRAGTINPMGYCRGLARAAKAAGAGISTGTTARRLQRIDDGWLIETGRGALRGRSVILGTNAYTDDLWPGLRRVFYPIHYVQLATEALGESAGFILPERQGVWNTAPIMSNFRRDAFDRLLIGTMGRLFGSDHAGLTQRWGSGQIRRFFPQLQDVRIQKAWHGKIALTPDHLPRILKLGEGLWTPIGYNGRGITTGTIMGHCMAQLLSGQNPEELPLPVTELSEAGYPALRAGILDLAFTARQALRSVI
ncbi:MAG: FAD-binding oxidoreductase [Rhodobacteraceae bacterium]|nr:FAD-binding oxidoreductase [Paracoccaceae bacterium]